MRRSPDPPVDFESVLANEYRHLGREVSLEGVAPNQRRSALYQQVSADPRRLSALCISGGGVRSATFGLGVLQGLAKQGLLDQFDYLSTVSGGGYIGGWLSAWIARRGGDPKRVAEELHPDAPAPEGGCDPVQHLREFRDYLTPQLGVGSLDTWTMAAIMMRNLLLNWVLLIPLLMLALLIPRLFATLLQLAPAQLDPPPWVAWVKWPLLAAASASYGYALINICHSVPSLGGVRFTKDQFVVKCLYPILMAIFALVTLAWWNWDSANTVPGFFQTVGTTLGISLTAWAAYVMRRQAQGLRIGASGPLTLAIALFGFATGVAAYALPHLILFHVNAGEAHPGLYATFGPLLFLAAPLLGGVAFVGVTSHSLQESDREWFASATAFALQFFAFWLLLCCITLMIPVYAFQLEAMAHSLWGAAGGIGALVTLATSRQDASPKDASPKDNSGGALKAWLSRAALLLFLLVAAISAVAITNAILAPFALASEATWRDHPSLLDQGMFPVTAALSGVLTLAVMVAGRFININHFSLNAMYRNRLVRTYLGASNPCAHNQRDFTGFDDSDNIDLHQLRANRPLHIVNATLNLGGGRRLDWQQRMGEPFTFSAFHCGSERLGYRDSERYGGGVELGTAMAISGAAVSPNEGAASTGLTRLVLMLLNARLGAWLGNPGPFGSAAWMDRGPRQAVSPAVREAFGLTDDQSPYVYLSDGAHFENLALYEMIRRRCRDIVLIDGGEDPEYAFGDLGNALRLVRIDFGVTIDFPAEHLKQIREGRRRFTVAHVHYPAGAGPAVEGRLLYMKPVVTGDEPPDVTSFHHANPDFPQETTVNQWFSEAQMESYRQLGLMTAEAAFAGTSGQNALHERIEAALGVQ